MKNLVTLIFACCFCFSVQAAAPSSESIEKLLTVAHAEQMLNAIRPQLDGMMKATMDQAGKGRSLTSDEQKIIDSFRVKVVAITNEELTMAKLKPLYLEIYAANFTQEEIDGLTAFYESPTGKAFIVKMPLVMQSIMVDMPKRLNPMLQKIEQARKEMKEALDALKKQSAK